MSVSPYSGVDFFEFFLVFFERMGLFCMGKLPIGQLATDEVQVAVLILVSISSALVGSFLVLKKMAMLANSLSHTILVGIVGAYLITLPFGGGAPLFSVQTFFIAALLTGLLTTSLTHLLTHGLKLQEDASIGLVFSTLFAVGVVLVTLFTRNTHLGVEAIMGNVDALHPDDLRLIFWITIGNILIFSLFYKEFKATGFDPSLARSIGISPGVFNYLLMVQTAATAIGAFRSVGVLLVLAFFVGPVLTARLFIFRLGPLLLVAALFGVLSSVIAVALARHFLSVHRLPLSTGGLVVVMIALVYLLLLMLLSCLRTYRKRSRKL